MTIKNILQGMRDTVAAYTPNAIKNGAAWAGRNIQVSYNALSARVNALFSYTVSTPVASIPVGKIGFIAGAVAIVAVAARVFQKELTEDEKLAADLKKAQAEQKVAKDAFEKANKSEDLNSKEKTVKDAAEKKAQDLKTVLGTKDQAVTDIQNKIQARNDQIAADKAAAEKKAKELEAEQKADAAEIARLEGELNKAKEDLAKANGEASSPDLDKSTAAKAALPDLEASVKLSEEAIATYRTNIAARKDELIAKAKKAKEEAENKIKQDALDAKKRLEDLKAAAKKNQEDIAAAVKEAEAASAKAAALEPNKGWFSFGNK